MPKVELCKRLILIYLYLIQIRQQSQLCKDLRTCGGNWSGYYMAGAVQLVPGWSRGNMARVGREDRCALRRKWPRTTRILYQAAFELTVSPSAPFAVQVLGRAKRSQTPYRKGRQEKPQRTQKRLRTEFACPATTTCGTIAFSSLKNSHRSHVHHECRAWHFSAARSAPVATR